MLTFLHPTKPLLNFFGLFQSFNRVKICLFSCFLIYLFLIRLTFFIDLMKFVHAIMNYDLIRFMRSEAHRLGSTGLNQFLLIQVKICSYCIRWQIFKRKLIFTGKYFQSNNQNEGLLAFLNFCFFVIHSFRLPFLPFVLKMI